MMNDTDCAPCEFAIDVAVIVTFGFAGTALGAV
jgi:hypothetical protein